MWLLTNVIRWWILTCCVLCPCADAEVVRPYTPVEENLAEASQQSSPESQLFFIIKIYPDGVLSSHLNSLSAGESGQ